MADNLLSLSKRSGMVGLKLREPYIPPLVRKVIPSIRNRNIRVRPEHEHFISPIIVKQQYPESPSVIDNVEDGKKFIISGYDAFFDLIKDNHEIPEEPEIKDFIATTNRSRSGCPCSRGPIKEAAKNIYARMLPLLQARNSSLFSVLKIQKDSTVLVFKEKDLVLLEV